MLLFTLLDDNQQDEDVETMVDSCQHFTVILSHIWHSQHESKADKHF